MSRKALSQEIEDAIQNHSTFGPMSIMMKTVWGWKERVLQMEREIERLRKELRMALSSKDGESG